MIASVAGGLCEYPWCASHTPMVPAAPHKVAWLTSGPDGLELLVSWAAAGSHGARSAVV